MHASEATLVPVIGTRDDQALATESVASFDLVVQLRRGVGELFDWVAVEPTESHHPRLMLSRESAAVVAAAMSELANSSPR
ncbi:hypothetical protein FXB39_03190 [Nocardioides sp. BGMRC 2183]|nr:hypothetical protein FXB39_03190 [Nocardioides sp. BGMRC 2183]